MKKRPLRSLEQPLYSYIKALFYSFFSIFCYIDVFKRWRGFGFKYLLFVLTILLILPTFWIKNVLHNYYVREFVQPIDLLPIFSVYNGQLVIFPEKTPYFIRNHTQDVTGLINTQTNFSLREAKLLKNKYPQLIIILQKNSMIVMFSKHSKKVNFRSLPNQTFWGHSWLNSEMRWVETIMTGPFLYLFEIGLGFGFMVMLGLVLALIFKVIAITIYRFHIKIRALMRLIYVALTPAGIVFVILLYFDAKSLAINWFLILSVTYINLALLIVKKEAKRLVHT